MKSKQVSASAGFVCLQRSSFANIRFLTCNSDSWIYNKLMWLLVSFNLKFSYELTYEKLIYILRTRNETQIM